MMYYPYYPQSFPQQQTYQQPQITQPQINQPQQQMQSGDDRIYVQGEVGAKAYLVAPGNTVVLWDSESQSIYIKTVNPAGLPSMSKLNYTFDTPQKAVTPEVKEELEGRIDGLEKAFKKLKKQLEEVATNVSKPDTDDSEVQ